MKKQKNPFSVVATSRTGHRMDKPGSTLRLGLAQDAMGKLAPWSTAEGGDTKRPGESCGCELRQTAGKVHISQRTLENLQKNPYHASFFETEAREPIDLSPIAGVARVSVAVAVPSSTGIANLKDFVAYSQANPDKVSYGVAPGFSEFVFDGFMREVGLKMAKVAYRDITTSPTDLGENRLQLVMMSYAAMRAHEESGKIKVIAINDAKRSPFAPNIPSVVESGFPSLVASPILGFVGHRDMPLALRQKIATDVVAVLQDKAIGERLGLTGQPVAPMGVEEFAAGVNEQHAQVARIAKVLGVARKN